MSVFWSLLALVALQRVIELDRSRKHVTRLLRRGAREHGAGHYPLVVGAHVLFYLSLAAEVAYQRLNPDLVTALGLSLFVVVQGVRLWLVSTLAERWTTRVLVLPGAPLVRRGPYRRLRHPNYLVVILELALLASSFRAWTTLALGMMAQAVALRARLRVENLALLPSRRPQ